MDDKRSLLVDAFRRDEEPYVLITSHQIILLSWPVTLTPSTPTAKVVSALSLKRDAEFPQASDSALAFCRKSS